MTFKRKRRNVQQNEGLSAGEKLKRHTLAIEDSFPWSWVGTEVTDASDISSEHRLRACGFSRRNALFCPNKYAERPPKEEKPVETDVTAEGELPDDVIVISEDEVPSCSKRSCRKNPNCLNYLGQDAWEDEDAAMKAYMSAAKLGRDPKLDDRRANIPVGLRNLGATCYANAFIQVWYQDLAFRNGVYQCQPSQDTDHAFEDSPVFQLQATFAALQEGKKSVFNPVKLVESLRLKTYEQQDAQEFSKLFMSHLDNEFQKQSDPALKRLIADQFQGVQAYTTTCQKCGTRSERDSDFLEIEVNLENNSSLESRIEALLQPETLSGDNQYLCSRCESLEDAVRQVILRKLPPILHFSLLRFVFDLNTMERKKSKHQISFPTSLDMSRFLESSAGPEQSGSPLDKSENIYDLQGILLHKGSSAYHGHYEATVFDVTHKTWFQFNDESVTKVKSSANGTGATDEEKPKGVRPRPVKKRRIEDSDDEVNEVPPRSSQTKLAAAPTTPSSVTMLSKDAYMLIYARRGTTSEELFRNVPKPPPRAVDAVGKLNQEHEERCTFFKERQEEAKSQFEELHRRITGIYRSWHISSFDQKSVVTSRQVLENFLARHLKKDTRKDKDKANGATKASAEPCQTETSNRSTPVGPSTSTVEMEDAGSAEIVFPLEDIVCEHGRLDPSEADDMKRVDYAAYQRMIQEERCRFKPELTPDDVCETCVRNMFVEKLYQYEHPKHVAQFDNVREMLNDSSYWISKQWVKDWRQVKPKMHDALLSDPPPDSDPYGSHVKCEHGGLSLNTMSRIRISGDAYALLRSLFPSWETLSDDAEQCAICEAGIQVSREDRQQMRKRAEDEKARLKYMHDNALNGNTKLLENVPSAMIPAQFVRTWRQWVTRPGTLQPRPEKVDTSIFLCEHGLLCIDPNSSDFDTSVTLVRLQDWRALEDLYETGPLITMTNQSVEDDHGAFTLRYEHEIDVCKDCRKMRKSDYDMTEITIRFLGAHDPDPTPETFVRNNDRPTQIGSQTSITTYTTRKTGQQRQSQRLRKAAQPKERRLCITKTMSVKDIKLRIQDELNVPTICQRLFYEGRELDDNDITVPALGILANDVLDLREENEDVDLLDEESDSDAPKRKKRDEGGGFGGTLLSGNITSDSLLDTTSEATSTPPTSDGICPACTYANVPTALVCEICDTQL